MCALVAVKKKKKKKSYACSINGVRSWRVAKEVNHLKHLKFKISKGLLLIKFA